MGRRTQQKTLDEELRHVYWIGGGSVASKSTIARSIAARFGFHLYSTDETMSDHVERSTAGSCPFMHRFISMDMDERWVNRPPKSMLETFHWFQGEGFELVIEDVLGLPRKPGVIVEGFRLLPRLVKPLLSTTSNAVWLLPSPDFRRTKCSHRESEWAFLENTSDPQTARCNLLERDRLFTDQLREEAMRLKLNTIEVDTAEIQNLSARAMKSLGLASACPLPHLSW